MTLNPQQFEEQLLGTATTRKRKRPIRARVARLAWGTGLVAIATIAAHFLGYRPTNLLMIEFPTAADLMAFLTGLIYLVVAFGEGATILEIVLMAVAVYCYIDTSVTLILANLSANAALYLLIKRPKPTYIFACCFATANLLRGIM